jgi:2-polyprenyl-3-methyl-5-hydroxy-6-metoxy-1,4-benzoquinol methylase
MSECIACGEEIIQADQDYVQCGNCNSYVYISDKTAEQENREYFDGIYKVYESFAEDTKKRKIFDRFEGRDRGLRRSICEHFDAIMRNKEELLFSNEKVLEIGFGQGDNLFRLLKHGADVYGMDISQTATNKFREKYPMYADRVECGSRFHKKANVVYCCALFEHLDNPALFLADVKASLAIDGFLIIDALPVLNRHPSDFTPDDDISFWKPCHRIIYSRSGLEVLLKKNGFQLDGYGEEDNYNYRVLSLHLRKGYQDITLLRNPCLNDARLPGSWIFRRICAKALKVHSLALYGLYIFRKVI